MAPRRRPVSRRLPWHVSIPHPSGIRENPRVGIRRQVAFRFAMSDRFEALVAAVPGARERSYQRARRYVAGATLDEALGVARDLLRQGLGVSLDAFGELVRDPAE